MKIKFAEPNHGWLPVKIESPHNLIEFETSDIPVEPLFELVNSLISIMDSLQTEIWWHLEPAGYYFSFSKNESKYTLDILYSKDSMEENKKIKNSFVCDFSEIILPIWRALKEFYSHKYQEHHWPEEPAKEMMILTNKIKEQS